MPSLCPLQCRHQWPAFVSHDYSVTVGIHEADKHGQTPDLLLYKNPNMLWTLTAAWGRLLKWNELVRLVRVDKKKKQIWESNIKWDSPIYRATAARGTKRHVDKNIRDIGGEAERDREGGRGRDMEGWQRDREGERGRDMEGGDAGEQSNSCWASHLLQVESSANRQTGTDPLRQAPGRERDGQRKSGTQRKAVGGGGWGEATRGWDEKDTIKKTEGGRRWKVHGGRKSSCNLLLPPQMEPMESSGAAWRMISEGTGISNHLLSTFPSHPLPSHPTPDILPPSLSRAFFLFSETDRTREACESKDERPVREVCALRMCVWDEWMTPLIPHPPLELSCLNTIAEENTTYNTTEAARRSLCGMRVHPAHALHVFILTSNIALTTLPQHEYHLMSKPHVL